MSNAPSLDDIRAFIVEMQPILGLRDWDFTVYASDDHAGEMQIEAQHAYRHAYINVRSSVLNGALSTNWRQTTIHELMHCFEDCYPSQIAALIDALPISAPMAKVLKGYIGDLEESFVDRAAMAVWRLVKGVRDANQKGLQQESDFVQHSSRDEAWEIAEASGSHRTQRRTQGPQEAR
jgi:hypothetical protein